MFELIIVRKGLKKKYRLKKTKYRQTRTCVQSYYDKVFQYKMALGEDLQAIYRTRIREKKPITLIYVGNQKVKKLLLSFFECKLIVHSLNLDFEMKLETLKNIRGLQTSIIKSLIEVKHNEKVDVYQFGKHPYEIYKTCRSLNNKLGKEFIQIDKKNKQICLNA